MKFLFTSSIATINIVLYDSINPIGLFFSVETKLIFYNSNEFFIAFSLLHLSCTLRRKSVKKIEIIFNVNIFLLQLKQLFFITILSKFKSIFREHLISLWNSKVPSQVRQTSIYHWTFFLLKIFNRKFVLILLLNK